MLSGDNMGVSGALTPGKASSLIGATMTPPEPEYLTISLTQGQRAIVDAADFDWLNRWKWLAHWNPSARTFYAERGDYSSGRLKSVSMHRQILGLEFGDKRFGDHQNRQTLDNRRSNLRIADRTQNRANASVSRNNKAKLKGAYWHRAAGKWASSVTVNRKQVHLGLFSSAELAHEAYREAARRFFGDFARDG